MRNICARTARIPTYKTWFDNLDAQAAAKVVTTKLRLAKDGDVLIILFGGGTKRGQQKDLDQAKALHAEYKDRKKALATVKKGKR